MNAAQQIEAALDLDAEVSLDEIVAEPTYVDIQRAVLAKLPAGATYMRAVAEESQNLSGSDLQGKAAKYGRDYARSRARVVELWVAAGGHVRRSYRYGRLSLEAGAPPANATPVRCAAGPAWRY